MRRLFVLAALLIALPAGSVTMDWVYIGDPFNAPDTPTNCLNSAADCGSVPYAYYISKYEVTNAQYVEFLNAVADDDLDGFYNTSMTTEAIGGITRSGSPGSYTYAVKSGQGNQPVSFVSWYDAAFFANWLHNGQPTGPAGTGTTHTGAYNGDLTRTEGALVFLPTENEWYKAAYYDAASASYFDYPTGTNIQTGCVAPGADTGNSANCASAVGALSDVGAYASSPSPYGTFDQGGNAWELNETAVSISNPPQPRGARGGSLGATVFYLSASAPVADGPWDEHGGWGFRVAYIPTGFIPVPEPGTGLLVMTGLLGLAARRRRRE